MGRDSKTGHRAPEGRRVPRGFTLIEAIIVLVIISIMSAIVAPRIDFEKYDMDGAAQQAGSAFIVAQRDAISSQHNMLVVFDTAHLSLRSVWDVNNNRQPDPGERVRVLALGERIRFGIPSSVPPHSSWPNALSPMLTCSGMPCLVFQRNGSTDRVAAFYLTSRRAMSGTPDREKDTRLIEISRASGRPETTVYTGTTWQRLF